MLLRKVMVLPLLAATPFAGITLTRFCGFDLRLFVCFVQLSLTIKHPGNAVIKAFISKAKN